uniref:Uncharacterized protein n=1 Tax=Oryza nivara TaxID=4536 RepID=A0A0E0GGY9_ORYNI
MGGEAQAEAGGCMRRGRSVELGLRRVDPAGKGQRWLDDDEEEHQRQGSGGRVRAEAMGRRSIRWRLISSYRSGGTEACGLRIWWRYRGSGGIQWVWNS